MVLAIVAVFVVGMVLGWALGRRDLVQELEALTRRQRGDGDK